ALRGPEHPVHSPASGGPPSVGLPVSESDAQVVIDKPSGLLGALVRLPTFQAFRYPQFRLLWYGQVGNGLGQWMDQVARGWLMYELTGSAVQLGAIIGIKALPTLLLSPLAGTLADRRGRKAQLIVAQSVDA